MKWKIWSKVRHITTTHYAFIRRGMCVYMCKCCRVCKTFNWQILRHTQKCPQGPSYHSSCVLILAMNPLSWGLGSDGYSPAEPRGVSISHSKPRRSQIWISLGLSFAKCLSEYIQTAATLTQQSFSTDAQPNQEKYKVRITHRARSDLNQAGSRGWKCPDENCTWVQGGTCFTCWEQRTHRRMYRTCTSPLLFIQGVIWCYHLIGAREGHY